MTHSFVHAEVLVTTSIWDAFQTGRHFENNPRGWGSKKMGSEKTHGVTPIVMVDLLRGFPLFFYYPSFISIRKGLIEINFSGAKIIHYL